MTNQFTLTDTFQVVFTKLPLGLVLNYDKDPDSDDDQEYYCGVRAVLAEAAEAKAQGVEKHMVLVAVNGAKCSEEENLADVIKNLKALPCTATFDRSDKTRAMCSRMEREAHLRKERKTRKRQQKEEQRQQKEEQQQQLAAMCSVAARYGSAHSGRREELEQHQARIMQHQLHNIRQQIDQVLPTMTAA
eukprot:g2612.t1